MIMHASLSLCVPVRAWLTGRALAPQTIAKTSGNHCVCIFPLVLSRQGCTNGICSDKQRPSMALIPCNWGWITICSPALHKGLFSKLRAGVSLIWTSSLGGPCRSGSWCILLSRLFFHSERWLIPSFSRISHRVSFFYSVALTIELCRSRRSINEIGRDIL